MSLPHISSKTYERVTLMALIALAVIIVTGGGVRVSGSGLGCPDWPTCTNNSVVAPLQWHPMIEFANRVFTGLVSVAVILAVLGSLVRVPRRRDLTWLSLSLVLGVLGQAIIGGLSVKYRLMPQWVMAHFLLSMVLVWAALLLYHRAKEPDSRPQPVVHRDYILLGRLMVVLAAAVLFVGTLVTGTGPHGGDEQVHRLGLDPHLVTKIHGSLVWLLTGVTALTVWRLGVARATSTLLKRGEIVLVALILQGALGYLQYSLHVPSILVLFHIAGATAVWTSILWFNLGFYDRYGELDITVYDGNEYPEMNVTDLAPK